MQKTILIVDDQSATRMMLQHYLGHFYKVEAKEDADQALQWMKDGNGADVIIMDMLLPGITGIEFLSQAKKNIQDLPPVIMLSSVENSTEKMKCFSNGARDYVTKPFNPEELRVRINNLLA